MSDRKLPEWLATLGVGVALGAAAVLLHELKNGRADDHSRSTLPNAAIELDDAERGASIALITGASPGTMGGSIAEALASLGCAIAAVEHPLRRTQCEELCQQLEANYGVRAVALTADATDAAQVEASFAAAATELKGEPNIVVSTVGGGGVAQDGSTRNGGTDLEGRPRTELAHEESWETTQVAIEYISVGFALPDATDADRAEADRVWCSMRILSVTQFSMHHCVKAGARHMISGGRGGSIIVVGSIMADFSHPSSSTYTSSKCAVKKLGEVMSRELAPHGIRVNVVQPGHIATANEVAYMDAATRYQSMTIGVCLLNRGSACSLPHDVVLRHCMILCI